MQPGEVLGLVGQSGSGKSTLALAILNLVSFKGGKSSGQIWFQGSELLAVPEREMRTFRGRRIGFVLQSPLSALNPALRVETQLVEAWRAHAPVPAGGLRPMLLSLLESVALPADEALLRRYPAQLSVGQAQRILIAMAIIHRPALLIADEPTSALDAITQSEILQLLGRLNRELGMAILYISHDLLSVAGLCHRIAILHQGEIVECQSAAETFQNPAHPYTRQLIQSLPANSFHSCLRDSSERKPREKAASHQVSSIHTAPTLAFTHKPVPALWPPESLRRKQ
jgi:ABC-type dipeptide/oligopeptide/nickel transport system ATPase component